MKRCREESNECEDVTVNKWPCHCDNTQLLYLLNGPAECRLKHIFSVSLREEIMLNRTKPMEKRSDRRVVPQSVGHDTLSFYFLFRVTVKDDWFCNNTLTVRAACEYVLSADQPLDDICSSQRRRTWCMMGEKVKFVCLWSNNMTDVDLVRTKMAWHSSVISWCCWDLAHGNVAKWDAGR